MDMGPSPSSQSGPLAVWRARVAAGSLVDDAAQRAAVERLQALWWSLRGYDPAPTVDAGRSLLSRIWRRVASDGADEGRPHGLYLVGDVGRGKSMLMDLFFAAAAVPRKRRVHFNRFMQDVHARRAVLQDNADPIPLLADALAAEAALLCFDEFQVTDIADAMILGRLFEALFARGVIVVATSNVPPARLFEGRPGRDAFLPFIALLQANLDVLVLDGARDWRRTSSSVGRRWHVPVDAVARRALDDAFAALSTGAPARPQHLTVFGRSLAVPLAAGGVARFSFSLLCQTALGAGDYLAVAMNFWALVLDDIPRLTSEQHDAARRFTVLIDSLYDHRVKLVASAAAPPDDLYADGEGAAAFRRTASRLIEMQADAWWSLPHLT